MPRTETEPLERIHVMLFRSDAEKLRQYFGGSIGQSRALRSIVRNYLRHLDDKTAARSELARGDGIDEQPNS